jgi:hypothetical protein
MNRSTRALSWHLALLAGMFVVSPWPPNPTTSAPDNKEDLRLPQRPLTRQECDKLAALPLEEIRQQLGPPRYINRQILNHRYLEQWLYEHPYFVRVEINPPRGDRKTHLLTVHPLQSAKP